MYLLSSRICSNKNEVIQVLKDYLKRWRIEELFRVQKKEFNIESIQLMTLAGVQMMYSFVNMLIGLYFTIIENDNGLTFIALKSTRNTQSHTKIKFLLYRIINGFSIVLKKDDVALSSRRAPLRQNKFYHQLSLF